jgi:hypothetical protein
MNNLSLTERQPIAVKAAVIGLLTALLHVLVVTGVVPVDAEDSIAGLIDAIGATILVVLSIRAVTPNAKVVTRVTTRGTVVAGEASTAPTGAPVELGAAHGTGDPVALAPVDARLLKTT